MPAKKTPSRKSRSTRTKADLEQELRELHERLEGVAPMSLQAESLAKEHIKDTREAVKGVSVDAIVAQGAQFGLQAQRTVAGLTEQIAAKATELKTLQDAILIEEEELTRLYGLDVASASVKALVQEHEDQKALIEEEISSMRKAWSEESAQHQKLISIREKDLQQARQRENDDYQYKTGQLRQKETDEWAMSLRAQQRAQAERFADLEKQMAEKTAAFVKEEKEIADLKTRVANIDSEISAKTAQAVAIATNSLKKDLTNAFALEKKDLELELRVVNEKNLSANAANEKLAQQVIQLGVQLEAARDQVRLISEKALESASGQVALTAVRETVKDNGAQGGGRKS